MDAREIGGTPRFVFFDAGNTLIFADETRTLAPLLAAGFAPTREHLYAAERLAKRRLDLALQSRNPELSVDRDFWKIYYTQLLGSLEAPPALLPALVETTRRSDNWNQVRPGTRETLEKLRQGGRRLGVISNSDGGIESLLRAVALGDLFESFTDSALVGHEKPSLEIFRHALATLGARPEESLFIGDVYSVDYIGGRAAGMAVVLMDGPGVYREDGLPRVESITELPALLG